jgi:hypothetical protein
MKLFFKGFNKRLLDKYNSKDDMPIELRSIYESLLEDKNKNGVPDMLDENGEFRQAIENGDVFITNQNGLDSLPSYAREKYEALMSINDSSGDNYGLDNSKDENHDLNQPKQNTLDNYSDEDIGVVKRNQNNSFSNLLVIILVVIGLVLLGAMLIN